MDPAHIVLGFLKQCGPSPPQSSAWKQDPAAGGHWVGCSGTVGQCDPGSVVDVAHATCAALYCEVLGELRREM